MKKDNMIEVEGVRGRVLLKLKNPLEEIVNHGAVSEINAGSTFHNRTSKRALEVLDGSYDPSRKSLRVNCYLSGIGQIVFVVIGNNYGHDPDVIKDVVKYIIEISSKYHKKF